MSPRELQLLHALERGLTLDEHPFAAIGDELALGEEEVIERARGWLAQGLVAYLGPQFKPGAGRGSELEQRLIDSLHSGVPLVPRPYEALGAVLGVSSDEVRGALAAMRSRGDLLCIAARRGQGAAGMR